MPFLRDPALRAVSPLLGAAASLIQAAMNLSDTPDLQEQMSELHQLCLSLSASVELQTADHGSVLPPLGEAD